METKYFCTLIPHGHILADNDYVAGRVSAALRLIGDTDDVICYGISLASGHFDTCYVIQTSDDKYERIKSVLENWYPGLCKFNYPLEKIETSLPKWL